jgi:hypothetical protein
MAFKPNSQYVGQCICGRDYKVDGRAETSEFECEGCGRLQTVMWPAFTPTKPVKVQPPPTISEKEGVR